MTRTKRPILKPLAAVALAIAAFAAPLASAQAATAPQQNRPQAQQHDDRNSDRDNRGQTGDRDRQNGGQNNRYGNWNASWGARPPAPPRSFSRTADWHRHVHACQTRFRSYNAATDRYTVRRGQTAVCRL